MAKAELNDLIDSHEAAAVLGLSARGAVAVYQRRYPDFPAPAVTKGKCLLWRVDDVRSWARQRGTIEPGLNHPLAQLEAMAREHVRYEVERMADLSRLGVSGARVTGPPGSTAGYQLQLVNQSILEAYLIHVRNVDEFLGSARGRRPLDVVGADYFDRPWRGGCLEPADRQEIDRRLAHLTLQRLGDEAYDWSGGQGLAGRARLADVALAAFGRFVADLESAHPDRAAWFLAT